MSYKEYKVDEADQNEQDERTWGVTAPDAYVVVTESKVDKSLRTTVLTGKATDEDLEGVKRVVERWRVERDPRPDNLTSHIQGEVFKAVLMLDATRREILKHPSARGVQIAFTPDPSSLLIRVETKKKGEPRVFKVCVLEQKDN